MIFKTIYILTIMQLLINFSIICAIMCMFNTTDLLTNADTENIDSIRFFLGNLLKEYFATIAAFSGLVIAVSMGIIEYFQSLKDAQNWIKQIVTLVVSILLSLVGWGLQIGIFTELSIIASVFLAIQISLQSNGLFSLVKGWKKNKIINEGEKV